MFNLKSKKGFSELIWLLAAIALVLVFLAVYGGGIFKFYNKVFSNTNTQINSAADADNDGVANFADKCPCKSGSIENNGCPPGYTPSGNEDKKCLVKLS